MKDYNLKTISNFRLESNGREMDRCKATCTYQGSHYEITVMNPHFSNICTKSYEEQAIEEIESGRARRIKEDELYEEESFIFWR